MFSNGACVTCASGAEANPIVHLQVEERCIREEKNRTESRDGVNAKNRYR
jgi:hypothetical protein